MRLAVLSAQGFAPTVGITPGLEGAFAQQDGTEVLQPPGLRRPSLRTELPGWLRTARAVRRADAVFWLQMSSRPHLPVWALAYTQLRVRRSAMVIDAWRPAVPKIAALARAQRLDPCFVPFLEAHRDLAAREDGRFVWMPFAADGSVFRERPEVDRDVFAYWMGRRHEPLHRALLAYCERHGLPYRYTQRPGEASDEELGQLVARSQYFVATPPSLDNPARTGGYSPFVMRYLEGPAAGSRLLGVLPREDEYDALLPRSAIAEVQPDGSDLDAVLDRERALGDDAFADRARLVDLVRDEHTWTVRARQVRDVLEGRPLQAAWLPSPAAGA